MDSPDFISVSPPRLHRSTSNSTLSSFVHLTSHGQNDRQSTTSSSNFSIRSLPDSVTGPSHPTPGGGVNPALSALSDASYLSLELEDLSLYTDTHDTYRYVAPHPPEIQYAFPSTPMAARYFPSNMPSRVARTIFALLDRHTLQSTLTVSKGWFRYAAGFLYRDPFDSERVHAQYCGTRSSLVSPSSSSSYSFPSASSYQSLKPSDERKLVRLLLRSIGCPSEPGEKEVLVCEENEWVMGRSKLVDEYGQQIQTSVNYIRFLEVFDWAPWQRYIDFWDSTQLLLEDEEEDKRAAVAQLEQEGKNSEPSDHDDDGSSNNNSSDGDGNGYEEPDAYYKQILFLKRKKAWQRARKLKKKEQRRGKKERQDKEKDVVVVMLFRFSYNTIFDWFAENPNARTIVVHPQMRFPFQLVPQLTRWSRLLFDQCEPSKDDVFRKRPRHEVEAFNPAALLQGILEHQMHSYINAEGRTVGGIRHLQLPPVSFYDDNDQLAEIQSLIDVIARPASLDVSAFPLWIYTAMGISNENLVELTRFVCLTAPSGFLSHQSFLRRCPNLKEIEMLVRDTRDVNFGEADVSYPYRDLYDESNDSTQFSAFDFDNYQDAVRSVERYHGPPTPATLKLTSAKLHVQRSADLPHVLAAMQSKFSDSLRELKLFRASPLYNTFSLCDRFELQGMEPFAGCPRLQRLTLISSQQPADLTPWRVPASLKELVLDGYDTQVRLDMDHLCADVPGLESLTLISTMPSKSRAEPPLLYWPRAAHLARLRTMTLSGMAAKSFRFKWMSHCPALETLEVDGLDYSQLTQGQQYTDDVQQMLLDPPTSDATTGPRVCKFSIVNMTCYHSMLYEFFCLSVANTTSTTPATATASSTTMDTTATAAESEMMWNRPLLTALRQHCPNVHRLTLDVKSCFCHPTGSTESHSELDIVTLSKLSQFLPRLIRFGTDSFKITGKHQYHLRSLGFVPRMEHKSMAVFSLPRNSQWEACAYRFGEASYQRHVQI
ncbi:hypothetical protein BGZ70_008282 [Mortierella alpina]|uniref:F-box domain-containing protein n=1 Tax=Mortierella alpina TaxID=64518 RepID=A0A9P6M115_MORAP|nr:hypothetical protein BGZ70_008282 [Mortierella alpina]